MRILLALLASAACLAAPGLRLGGEPFLPYRINLAVASQEDGVFGHLELQGQRWDGSQVTLFRTQVKARSQAVDLAFYLDEDIRSLILQVDGQSTVVDLAASEARGGVMTAGERALRTRMRRLTPPVYLAPDGEAPQHFTLQGSELFTAGSMASSSLFRIPISHAPLGLLGGFAGVALLLAVMPFHSRRGKMLARVFATGLATLAVLFLADRRPTLFSVTFPGDDPGARLSGTFERRVDEQPGYRRVAYLAGQGPVALVGLWVPVGLGIPLETVVPPGALARFSAVPLLTRSDGGVFIGAKGFVTGWVVHENH